MIESMFDDDLYKFTMQQAVLKLYSDTKVKYRFKNRGNHKFNDEFLVLLKNEIDNLCDIKAEDNELEKFSKLKFISPWYVDFLRSYRYDKSQLNITLDDNNDLNLEIEGFWYSTILWEVKLMALISECYFKLEQEDGKWSMDGHDDNLELKANKLVKCRYADFGTRRRRSFAIQDSVVNKFKNYYGFIGTSNVHLAFKYNIKPIGTMAHEWIQGVSALESLNHPNRVMLKRWLNVYKSELGIALTDTFGTNAFLKDFDSKFARLFEGVRHDSGDPFEFSNKIVEHYKKLGINPQHKFIVFSDSLNPAKAVKIKNHCDDVGINCSFGIGTNFTNDFSTSPLNMVIKLWEVNGTHVVKLSDNPDKANGDPKAIEMIRWLYGV